MLKCPVCGGVDCHQINLCRGVPMACCIDCFYCGKLSEFDKTASIDVECPSQGDIEDNFCTPSPLCDM
jgi:hypothetical protein